MTTETYTVRRVSAGEVATKKELAAFFTYAGSKLAHLYGDRFNFMNFSPARYTAMGGRMMVCFRDGEPCGAMLMRLYDSVFDEEVRILMQDTLFAEPGTLAAKLLMDDFIDFGRRRADHIITMIAERTNIKPRSLARLGFKQLETLYRLET